MLTEGVSYIAQRRGDRPPRYGEKTPSLHVGRGTGPRHRFASRPHPPIVQDRLILTRSGSGDPELQRWAQCPPPHFSIGIRPPPKAG